MRIAIAGDYCEGYATHRAMLPALADAGAEGIWVPTGQAEQALEADGIWLAPGNPYASFDAVLGLVRFARERNVLGIADADTAEHTGGAGNRVLIPVVCPISNNPGSPKLFGGELVHFLPESRLRRIMGVDEAPQEYFCNFEENPLFREHFEAAGLRISAVNPNGVARAVELDEHPFFPATRFQPRMNSRPGHPHPLLAEFVRLLTESA